MSRRAVFAALTTTAALTLPAAAPAATPTLDATVAGAPGASGHVPVLLSAAGAKRAHRAVVALGTTTKQAVALRLGDRLTVTTTGSLRSGTVQVRRLAVREKARRVPTFKALGLDIAAVVRNAKAVIAQSGAAKGDDVEALAHLQAEINTARASLSSLAAGFDQLTAWAGAHQPVDPARAAALAKARGPLLAQLRTLSAQARTAASQAEQASTDIDERINAIENSDRAQPALPGGDIGSVSTVTGTLQNLLVVLNGPTVLSPGGRPDTSAAEGQAPPGQQTGSGIKPAP